MKDNKGLFLLVGAVVGAVILLNRKEPTSKTGFLVGVVTSSDGYALPEVSVKAVDASNQTHNTLTEENGTYNLTELAIGPCSVTFEKEGYGTVVI